MKTIVLANAKVYDRAGANNPYHVSARIRKLLTKDFLSAEYVEKHRNQEDIAHDFGLCQQTICNYLRKHGLIARHEGRRLYPPPTNLEGFESPSSDWHAYWLGFIAADGCVFTADGRRTHNIVKIEIKGTDIDHLNEFRRGLGTPVTIKPTVEGKVCITIHSSRFVKILQKWGIVQRKSLVMPFPLLPAQYLWAYIGGYFDGDGTIYWRSWRGRSVPPQPVCRFISGSHDFLFDLSLRLQRDGIETRPIQHNKGSRAMYLPLSSRRDNLRRFAGLLYPKACIALPRKCAAFEPLFERMPL
ncbi:MAG TPA: LAGLIDADG family homing endonuclease [Pyrinomonadaceae bacterium]|jgi:hypothetical protein